MFYLFPPYELLPPPILDEDLNPDDPNEDLYIDDPLDGL